MSTGIFFHYQTGDRLKDFPEALDGILHRDNVLYYDAHYPLKPTSTFDIEPIPIEDVLQVHSPEMVARVRDTGAYEGALYSAAGTFSAALRVWSGELKNAFVFTGYGDHHAGIRFFSGGCYFNGAAIAIHMLKERFGGKRFAIVDTDAHHGDGTWDIFEDDPDVMVLCFCSGPAQERNQNINIHLSPMIGDQDYLHLARGTLERRVKDFHPQMIFWNWGYDGTSGEYGDMGLTPGFHFQMAKELKALAGEFSDDRFIIVLCGGSRRDLATLLIPPIIEILIYP